MGGVPGPLPDEPGGEVDDAVTTARAEAVRRLAGADPVLARCLAVPVPFRWERRLDGFAGLIQIILEQQVSTAAGVAMWRKLTRELSPVTPAGLVALDDETLRRCGFSRQKIGYARGLAAAVLDGRLDLADLAHQDDAAVRAALTAHKGIGRWSADIYLLLSLDRPDVWPVDDLAIVVGVQRLTGAAERPSRADLDARAEAWRPWRSAAARLVWHHYLHAGKA